MKLSLDQMTYAELKRIQVGDRLILHWQTAPNTIRHLNGVVSQINGDTFYVRYFREGNPNWETAFFWNDFGVGGTTKKDFRDPSAYLWSFTRG